MFSKKRQNAAFAAIASHRSGKTSTRRKNRVPRVDISDNAERHDADALNIPASPYPDGDKGVMACPNCGSGEYLHNADENENAYCGQCGQAIKWGCEDED